MVNPKGHIANLHPFQSGQSGNPGGKPVGARNKLQGDFMNALAADFEEHGAAAIAAAREKDPAGYLRCVVSLMPKQLEPGDGMSIADLIAEAGRPLPEDVARPPDGPPPKSSYGVHKQ